MDFPKKMPPQKQDKQPGLESLMNPKPIFDDENYKGANKLLNKITVITGGDSGIGKAVSIAFAKEGADIAIIYLNEHEDATETKKIIDSLGRRCLIIPGDVGDETFCKNAIDRIINDLGKIDILINNAAEQHVANSIEDISYEQLQKTFKTNIFSMFYMTRFSLPYLKEGSSIINTASITAYKGDESLIDYSSSKGAVVTFTRSMALSLAKKGIRVNAVAPGPIWTPLIPSSFDENRVSQFGSKTAMGRPGQPVELAAAYVFLASNDASYITGEILHINGGEITNS